MTKDQIRESLAEDVSTYRRKATQYRTLRLFEAAHYAEQLAANIELALTTLPSDEDQPIA